MCLSCGCKKTNDDHGDNRHITMKDVDQAAQAANITREQAAQNIMSTVTQGKGQQGQQSSSSQSPRT